MFRSKGYFFAASVLAHYMASNSLTAALPCDCSKPGQKPEQQIDTSALGDCKNLKIEVSGKIRANGTMERTFRAADNVHFNFREVSDIQILTSFMCETLINSCGLQENDTQVMKCNNLSSDVGTGDKVHLADNWNAGCGISTNFAGGSNKSIPDATTATGDLSKDQNVTSNVTATIPKAANTTEFELPGDQNSTTTLLGTKNATDVELPSRKIQRACRRRRPSPAGANKNTSESEIPSIKNSTALNTTTVPGTANATEPKTLGDKNEAAVNKTALPELTKNSTALEISGDQNKTAVNSTSLPEASKNTTGLGIQSNQSKTAQSTNFPSGLTNFTKLDVASTRNATNSKNISAEKGQNQEDQKNGKEKKIKPSEEVK